MALQEETGYAYDDLVKMGEGMAKFKLLQGEFKIGGFSKEDQQFISNVAQYSKEKDGFTVKLGLGEEKLVSQIGSSDLEKIKTFNAPVKLEDLAKEQLSVIQTINQTVQSLVYGAAAPVAASKFPADAKEIVRAMALTGQVEIDKLIGNTRNTIQTIDGGYQKLASTAIKTFSGKASGADYERLYTQSTEAFFKNIEKGAKNGKISNIVVVSEGEKETNIYELAKRTKERFPHYETRISILGHIQRGGSPSAYDRVLAS
jgi:hypothetical protein